MQRVTVAPGMLVHGGVAGAANGAEELVDLGGQGAGVAKALEEVHLLLVRESGEAEVGGGGPRSGRHEREPDCARHAPRPWVAPRAKSI